MPGARTIASRRPSASADASSADEETLSAFRGTTYAPGAAASRTLSGGSATLGGVVDAGFPLTPLAEPQPAWPAASAPTTASSAIAPAPVLMRPMTPMTLPVGNYPLVSAPVLSRSRPASMPSPAAPLRFETISSEEEFGRLQ